MSSDSGLSDVSNAPDDETIERTLRRAVRDGNIEVSVNNVRLAVQEQLKLSADFFKTGAWKNKSKSIIEEAFNEPASQRSPSPVAPPPTSSRTKPAVPTSKAAKKRSSSETIPPAQKRQKQAPKVAKHSDDDSEAEGQVDRKPVQKIKAPRLSSESEEDKGTEDERKVSSADESDLADKKPTKQKAEQQVADGEGSESELSDVIDEPPKKRRQKSASVDVKTKAKPAKASKPSAAASKDVDPDEAEMKRLQGWLIKCGIRKLWYKELASYSTAKAKIKHLKDMLKDAGMDGRYSVEKARTIKEQRELAADLEAVQEGAKKWGNDGSDESEEETKEAARPKRKGVAARFVDFGDSGEDSD